MIFHFPDNTDVVACGFHAAHPSFPISGLDFEWLINPMRVIRMEKNDGFRKQRQGCKKQQNENTRTELEAVHQEAYSTEKKLMSNEPVSLVAHSG
jgi:hypothetical protein